MMEEPMMNIHFRMMSLLFAIRDRFSPRKKIVEGVGIRAGLHILDFGCGPGSYVAPTAALVGESGKVYALDIHPLALHRVKKIASQKGLNNVETIQSDCLTGLPDNSIDVVLLYDTFHEVGNPEDVLRELHRVLKVNGILSFSDHHLEEQEIVSRLTEGGLFRQSEKGDKIYRFLKVESRTGS